MIIARDPVQRPIDAKLLAIDPRGRITHWPRRAFPKLLMPGDLVIANDAATLPVSLQGAHLPSGERIEVRLVQRRSLEPDDVRDFAAIVFGEGDHRTPTEDRAPPPPLAPGDVLDLGPLRASVRSVLGHPRFVAIRFDGTPQAIWRGLATHGKPIQYAYMRKPLRLWDVWTPIAGAAAAFEPPSAGFALDWEMLSDLRRRSVNFATITHAAGISSTGDEALDALLPFDEPYVIPVSTADAIERARDRGRRIIAVGTTVVRALEAAAIANGKVSAGSGVATQRIGPHTRVRVVDAVLSGTHEPGTSHYALLGAFASPAKLREADRELEAHGYRTHEYGDSVFVERCDVSPVNPSPSAAHTRRSDPIPAA